MSYQCISPEQAMELISAQGATVIDVRDAMSFSRGHITGARRVDGETIAELLEDTDADDPLIVCCHRGVSSKSTAEYLAAKGFSNVYSLEGGFEAWTKSYPPPAASH